MYLDKFSYDEEYQPEHIYVYHIKCSSCGEPHDLRLPAQGLFNLRQGAYIQNAFPMMSPDEREMCITGICGKCWDKMFPPESDEEEPELSNCGQCNREFPVDLLNSMTIIQNGIKQLGKVCPICALAIKRKVHGPEATFGPGTEAEWSYQEALKIYPE